MCKVSIRLAMRLGAVVVLIWKWQGSAWRTSDAASPVTSLHTSWLAIQGQAQGPSLLSVTPSRLAGEAALALVACTWAASC